MPQDAPQVTQVSAQHTAMHDALLRSLQASQEAINQIQRLENDLRVRRAVLRDVISADLREQARALQIPNPDEFLRVIDEILQSSTRESSARS